MSVSSGIAPSEKLKARLEEMRVSGCNVQVLKVEIQGDVMEEVNVKMGSPTKDLHTLAGMADENSPCYFILHTSPNKWAVVTWVPEGVKKVKDKMIYASSHSALKSAFGNEYISEDIHVTSKDDVYGKSLVTDIAKEREALLSHSERNKMEANRQENIARKELENSMKTNEVGGYHAVSMKPLDNLIEGFSSFKSGSCTWIEMKIGEDQSSIEVVKTTTPSGELNTLVDIANPRYYLYKSGNHNVFIYSCPEKSPTKLRMVYSTGKPSVVSQIESNGIHIDKKMEVSDSSEVTQKKISDEISNVGRTAWDAGKSKNPSSNAVNMGPGSHPLYGQMKSSSGPSNLNNTPAATRSPFEAGVITVGNKKIILPPSVAYQ